MKKTFYSSLILLLTLSAFYTLNGQCPTGDCATHITEINTSELFDCDEGPAVEYVGNVDNNSDCGVAENCWKYKFVRHDPIVIGLSMDIGKGNGCTGEVDTCYAEVDGTCINYGDSGSHSHLDIDFGVRDSLIIWICDNSSGNVSICVCANLLSPTPVELEYFTADVYGNQVMLNWKTISEEDNNYFQIQRSKDGQEFENIGKVEGAGTTELPQNYTFIDRQPMGTAYYRLKQIDMDGAYHYSDVVFERSDEYREMLNIFPSIARDQLTIAIESNSESKADLWITYISGETVYQTSIQQDLTYLNLDVSNYQPGIYFATLSSKFGIITNKFIITRE